MKFTQGLILVTFLFVAFKSYSYPVKENSKERERNISLKLTYKFSIKGHIDSLTFVMVIPQNIDKRQVINETSFSEDPFKTYKEGNNTYALFKFYDVKESFKIVVKQKITIYQSIDTAAGKILDSAFSQYLLPEPYIESSSPEIIKVAETLKQKTDIETIMKTYDYVKEHIVYKVNKAVGAEGVLESGEGKCMDFSVLFIALLRANKIPAKYVHGMTVDYNETPFHAWSEAFLKKQGWVQFDPTSGQSAIRLEGKNYVMSIKNKYVTFSEGRNNIGTYYYRFRWRSSSKGQVTFKHSYEISESSR
ncbi:MAG: transglutaminase family protein [Bacteroidota bacterium]